MQGIPDLLSCPAIPKVRNVFLPVMPCYPECNDPLVNFPHLVKTNVTPNVTATPVPLPDYIITFTKDLTIVPNSGNARVPVGTKVTWWDNDPYKDHSLQSTNTGASYYFGTGTVPIPHDGNFSVVFDKAGSYGYMSVYQPNTQATIIVY